MKPVDIRNENFESLQGRVVGTREEVLYIFQRAKQATTREVAEIMRLDVLSVRPRATELYQVGALELAGRVKCEGIYRARTVEEWRAWADAQRETAVSRQQQLL